MGSESLASRLRKLRDQKGYLQKYVADRIGIKSNTLSGYENGTRSPDPDMINELAKLYDVTTDYLLGRTDNPNPYNNEFNPMNEINKLLDKYEIEDSGFFDIEKWKAMGPDEIKQLEEYFEFITSRAKKRKDGPSNG